MLGHENANWVVVCVAVAVFRALKPQVQTMQFKSS
jgi:hypothetical protein